MIVEVVSSSQPDVVVDTVNVVIWRHFSSNVFIKKNICISIAGVVFMVVIHRMSQTKRGHLSFLLVTIVCIYKI